MTLGDAVARGVSDEKGVVEDVVFDEAFEKMGVDPCVSGSHNIRPKSITPQTVAVPPNHDKDESSTGTSSQFTLSPENLLDSSDEESPSPNRLSPTSRLRNNKNNEKAPARGRTPSRESRRSHPFERAESRSRRKDPAIEIDARSIKISNGNGSGNGSGEVKGRRSISRSSTFFEDPEDPLGGLEDRMLEPCPHIPICENVSEVLEPPENDNLSSANTPLKRIRTASSFHNLLNLNKGSNQGPSDDSSELAKNNCEALFPVTGGGLHPERAGRMCSFAATANGHPQQIGALTGGLATNSTSPHTPASFGSSSNHSESNTSLQTDFVPPTPPPVTTASSQAQSSKSLASALPAEILQQIYIYLSPQDFNAARHVARGWYIHSLHQGLLERMLRRMGFSHAIETGNGAVERVENGEKEKYEWRISKLVARECALGAGWRGNGLPSFVNPVTVTENERDIDDGGSKSKPAFTLISTVDFRGLSIPPTPRSNTKIASTSTNLATKTKTLFTVSACDRFLMVSNGCMVYVYELNRNFSHSSSPDYARENNNPNTVPGSLRPITSIITPTPVKACSMDTSSDRYAIGILLEGRMALVCDLSRLGSQRASSSAPSGSSSMEAESDGAKTIYEEGKVGDGVSGDVHSGSCARMVFLDRVSLSCPDHNYDHENPHGGASGSNDEAREKTAGFANMNGNMSGNLGLGLSRHFVDQTAWQDLFKDDTSTSRSNSSSSSSLEIKNAQQHTPHPHRRPLSHDHSLQSHDQGDNSHTNVSKPTTSPKYHQSSRSLAKPKPKPNPIQMPLSTTPRSLFKNLCTPSEPPISVAICPQRRCVAFGCSSGIELHWVDALTGQNLNRWFPVGVWSEVLFFLRPKVVDREERCSGGNLWGRADGRKRGRTRLGGEGKKLRLISSCVGMRAMPEYRSGSGALNDGMVGTNLVISYGREYWAEYARNSNSSLSPSRRGDNRSSPRGGTASASASPGETLLRDWDRQARSSGGRTDFSDHYKAIPLSDGQHILFTDPATGLLCLGSDAPLGGPTKLLRKIWFEGKGRPVVYRAGELVRGGGVRVVCVFEEDEEEYGIYFFTVPPDVFKASQNEPAYIAGFSMLQPSVCRNNPDNEWMKWWGDDGLERWFGHVPRPRRGDVPRSTWPVRIEGQRIAAWEGAATGLDLVVEERGGLWVWVFGGEGVGRCWAVGDGRDQSVRSYLVSRDGTVRDGDSGTADDGDEDEKDERKGVRETHIRDRSQESFDGADRQSGEDSGERKMKRRRVGMVSRPGLDGEGDEGMLDINIRDDGSDWEGSGSPGGKHKDEGHVEKTRVYDDNGHEDYADDTDARKRRYTTIEKAGMDRLDQRSPVTDLGEGGGKGSGQGKSKSKRVQIDIEIELGIGMGMRMDLSRLEVEIK